MKDRSKIKTMADLFTKADRITKIINCISLYRTVTVPILLTLLFTGHYNLFKWLLLISFFTDLIDGFLARKFKVTSVLGSRLDSLGDDLTILVAVIGIFKLRFDFIKEQVVIVVVLLSLFIIQLIFALIRYGKVSSFHTYGAKAAALLQGVFLLSIFFFEKPVYLLFYMAALISALDLIEEIILVQVLPQWKTDVKGLYWVLKEKKRGQQ